MLQMKTQDILSAFFAETRKIVAEEIDRAFSQRVASRPVRETDAMSIVETEAFLRQEFAYPVTVRSIYDFVHRGNMPCRKIGKRLVFSREALRAWVAERTRNAAPRRQETLRSIADAGRKEVCDE